MKRRLKKRKEELEDADSIFKRITIFEDDAKADAFGRKIDRLIRIHKIKYPFPAYSISELENDFENLLEMDHSSLSSQKQWTSKYFKPLSNSVYIIFY